MTTTTFTRVKSTVAPRTDLKRWLPADDGEHRAAISHAYRILDGVLDSKGKPLSKDLKTIILRPIAAVPRLSDLGHGTRFESAQAWDATVQRYADRCKDDSSWATREYLSSAACSAELTATHSTARVIFDRP